MTSLARILLVDDQPSGLLTLEAALAPLGRVTAQVTSAEDALKLLLREEFSVVLMDVRLPGMSGLEAVRLMKQSERTRRVPVVLVSAFPDYPDHQVYQTGAVDFLLKPFEPEVLRAKVSAFVELYEERDRALLRERESARAEAEAQRALLAPIVEKSPDAILMADAQGVLRLANPEAERMLGRHLVGQNARGWAQANHMADERGAPLGEGESPLERALRGETVRQELVWVERPDGTRRAISVTASPLLRNNGQNAGAVWVAREETQRLLLEEERSQTLALLDAVLGSAPVGLAFFDRSLRYLRVNHMLAELNGVSPEEHLGRTPSDVLPSERAVRMEGRLRAVLESGEPLLGLDVTLEGIQGNAEEQRHFVASYYPVQPPGSDVMGVGLVVVEITDRKRYELQMQKTAEFRERFLGAVGHDLRSPLSAILAGGHILERGDLRPDQMRRAGNRIRGSAERMARMISELLDFTRGRLGSGMPVEASPTDLGVLCREGVEEVTLAHPDQRVELKVEGDLCGRWDSMRLSQVVSNLLANAVRHGDPTLPIEVHARGFGEEVQLAVHNGGEPIPPDLIPHLFEPFQRGEQVGKASGLGLGLFIVQQVVLSHGGEVQVSSTQEDGTTFLVKLPREPPPQLASHEEQVAPGAP